MIAPRSKGSREMVHDTWYTRALPILEAISKIEVETSLVQLGDLARETGCTAEEVDIELERLLRAGYAGGTISRTMTGGRAEPWSYVNPILEERGARAIGQWPSDDPYDALIELLDRRINDDATDAETRTKLQRLRGTLVDVGKGVAGGVLGSLIRAGLGLP